MYCTVPYVWVCVLGPGDGYCACRTERGMAWGLDLGAGKGGE